MPLINHGHEHFGENKVQESVKKWTDIKQDFLKIKLHMIGKLQSNKVKYVIPLFDYIHSLDNLKLAEKISNEKKKINKKVKIFISDIKKELDSLTDALPTDQIEFFYKKCTLDLGLDIVGLMCLPPKEGISLKYFTSMKELLNKIHQKELSMGMSNDYLEAAINGSTFLRIGSKIFGKRD